PPCHSCADHTFAGGAAVSIWDQLVGQAPVVDALTEAIQSTSMTHAWLFTGPPGSGRSVAAKAFAAALQCPDHGCGVCESCTVAQAGSHPDIGVLNTQGLSIGVDTAREYVRRAALHPARDAGRSEEHTSELQSRFD